VPLKAMHAREILINANTNGIMERRLMASTDKGGLSGNEGGGTNCSANHQILSRSNDSSNCSVLLQILDQISSDVLMTN
jgi:hypothetical protein